MMTEKKGLSQYATEWQQGYDAAKDGKHFSEECPYTFRRTNFYPNDTSGFDRECRPRLDAWWAGWSAYLKENGLGNNFKPIKAKP